MRRMFIVAAVALFSGCLGLIAFLPATAQEAKPKGGEMGQILKQLQIVETYWAGLAFEVKVDDATLLKARPVLQKAYDRRKAVMEQARADQTALQQLANFQAEVDAELRAAIGDEAFNALQAAGRAGKAGGKPAKAGKEGKAA